MHCSACASCFCGSIQRVHDRRRTPAFLKALLRTPACRTAPTGPTTSCPAGGRIPSPSEPCARLHRSRRSRRRLRRLRGKPPPPRTYERRASLHSSSVRVFETRGSRGSCAVRTLLRIRARFRSMPHASSRSGLPRPVRDRLSPSALAGADDRIAHLCRTVAVLERRPVGGDVGVASDCGQDVVQLVHEGITPTDDVARGPPVLPERMARLRDEHVREPTGASDRPS